MEEAPKRGRVRDGYSQIHHEIFDLYHDYIGDKATLYYLLLQRHRNNDTGKSWPGRKKIVEEYNFNYTQVRQADDILVAADLITIEHKPVGRGRPKNIYYVHDADERQVFRDKEADIIAKLTALCEKDPKIVGMLGRKFRKQLKTNT